MANSIERLKKAIDEKKSKISKIKEDMAKLKEQYRLEMQILNAMVEAYEDCYRESIKNEK